MNLSTFFKIDLVITLKCTSITNGNQSPAILFHAKKYLSELAQEIFQNARVGKSLNVEMLELELLSINNYILLYTKYICTNNLCLKLKMKIQ